MLSSNAFFNRIPISHECLDNPVRKRWVLTGAGIQGSRLVTLGRLALLNCILVSHKYFTMVTMVTIGGDLQPGCLADRLLTGLGQPQISP